MSNDYYSNSSDNVDMSKFSKYVRVTAYPNHIDAVGISYQRPFRTISEIQKDIADLKNLPLSQEEYDKRLKKLCEELEGRRQNHSPPHF